jgi:hypothetical protein
MKAEGGRMNNGGLDTLLQSGLFIGSPFILHPSSFILSNWMKAEG